MRIKVQGSMSCEKCGRSMEVENVSKARYTIFILWRCSCGFQHLEKRHEPVAHSV